MRKEVKVNGTRAVHAGERRAKAHHAVAHPIVATATYTFETSAGIGDHFEGRVERNEYGRYGNPTVRAAELKLAALDGAEDAACFSSGMAAITTTLLALLGQGDHVVMTRDCYRRTRQFVIKTLARYGVEATLVDPGDYAGLEGAIRPGRTRLIVAESPTNPYLRVADLERLVAIKDRYDGVSLFIDSTFATPINQRPVEWGVDLVTHSCTKYLGGHNDLLAGVVCGRAALVEQVREFRGVLGCVLDPHAAYLLIRGTKTLELRVGRQNATGLAVARFLEQQPRVKEVFYPGLEGHPDHAVAKAQMSGFGGVVSFLVDADLDGTSAFVDACRIPQIGPSLGGVESLIMQPTLISFYHLTPQQRREVGARDNLVRLSLGIEDTQDILDDLAQALTALERA